ncbi:MAG TPA: tryptophan 7-halogenase [Silvibacterium sp.]|nr:tryptophan 7-halogenase [Silvibacterium sp.]
MIGSGFAGSLMAMIAQRLGKRVVLVERGKHPRVVIGESSTPLSNLLLDELAARYCLPLRPLTKWGSWQSNYPEIACGLKRGFSFFHHRPAQTANRGISRENQLLVAASPHDAIADTHWYRADIDQLFVQQAQELGVEYLDEVNLSHFSADGQGASLQGTRHNKDVRIAARFVIDATGPRGFLHNALGLQEDGFPAFPETQALYSHFSGATQFDTLLASEGAGLPPYPVDDAAVHHIFEGGWIWVLRFNNDVTSAGIAATPKLANQLKLTEGGHAWERVMEALPSLREQFKQTKPVQPFRHIPRLAFRTADITGGNWALLPSTAGFVDPLLSTGFPLTLLGITRMARIFERDVGTGGSFDELERYSRQTDSELVAVSRLISALYANMSNFPVFKALTLIYFAAAIYSETVRRLGKPEMAASFLLHDDHVFGPGSSRLLQRARAVQPGKESEELIEDILRFIEPFDVAGLCDRDRSNWYPVRGEDLLNSAAKVNSCRDEVMRMLERSGFWPATSVALERSV